MVTAPLTRILVRVSRVDRVCLRLCARRSVASTVLGGRTRLRLRRNVTLRRAHLGRKREALPDAHLLFVRGGGRLLLLVLGGVRELRVDVCVDAEGLRLRRALYLR